MASNLGNRTRLSISLSVSHGETNKECKESTKASASEHVLSHVEVSLLKLV